MPLILEQQRKRGPDHASHVHMSAQNLQISMAHNRLAILDLTDESNQPFVDLKTGACIVFNGEIYNYRELRDELASFGETFTTNGDTEVLLKAFLRWGTDTYRRLNGMFAFAVWNPTTGKLTLARDRFGVKPCYYMNRLDQFAFASSTPALARFFKPRLDMDYLTRGIIYNLYEDANGGSPFEEIRSVPPGHYLEVTREKFTLTPFYDFRGAVLAQNERVAAMSEAQILEELEAVLRRAVNLRLRSDVPVTISMSGGLDSALLASLIKDERRRDPDAFTFGSLNNPHSEAHLAKASADRLGINLHYVDVPMADLPAIFEKTLLDQGAPFAHPTVMAQNAVFEEMNRQGYKVSIGGQGADEVFMGYRKFQFFYMRDLIRRHSWWRAAGAAAGIFAMLAAEAGSLRKLMLYRKRYADQGASQSPFRDVHSTETIHMRVSQYRDLQDRQIADVGFASLLTLLRYEDCNSMGHSVESRMPFLDYNVMQFGSAIPVHMKIRRGYGKHILRRLAGDRLPAQITQSRAKLAFALDPHEWLREGLGQHIQSRVSHALPRLESVFSDSAMDLLREKGTYVNPHHFPLIVTAYWLSSRV